MRTRSTSLLGVLAVIAGCNDRGNEYVAPPPPKVTVANPAVQSVTFFLEMPGRLEAIDSVAVRARVRGYLQTVDFEPGTVVQEGDLLFTIESERYEAALESAQGRLAQARAALVLMEATLERVQAARAQQAASDLEVLEAEANRDAAAGAVKEQEAAVSSAEIDLGYTRIHSPIAGRVDRELVDAGNLVGANEATLLTTVLADDPIYAYFNVNERDLLRILGEGRERRGETSREDARASREIFLTLADGSDFPLGGRIDFGANRVNPDTGTLQARAIFPNAEGILYPGLFVRVRVAERSESSMLVPPEIILRDVAGPYVLTVNEQSVVVRRGVTLGPLTDDGQVITAGLGSDDRVIVNGWQRARPDAPVEVVEQSEP